MIMTIYIVQHKNKTDVKTDVNKDQKIADMYVLNDFVRTMMTRRRRMIINIRQNSHAWQ
jgi:hypothetical protein